MRMISISLAALALLLLACSDDGGDVGDGLADEAGTSEASGTEGSSTGESSTDTGTSDTSTSDTSTSETGTSDTSTSETGTSETGTTDTGTSETGTTDTGDMSCEDDQYLGAGIADDGWTAGSFCDAIYVCADAAQALELEALDPAVDCTADWGCADLTCELSMGGIVDAAQLELVCSALLVSGIDAAYCVVLGP